MSGVQVDVLHVNVHRSWGPSQLLQFAIPTKFGQDTKKILAVLGSTKGSTSCSLTTCEVIGPQWGLFAHVAPVLAPPAFPYDVLGLS